MLVGENNTTFGINLNGGIHFYIDCGCGGNGLVDRQKKYSGAYYGDKQGFLENLEWFDNVIRRGNGYAHTFMLSDIIFETELMMDHRESAGQSPLVVVCKDCRQNFPFTYESYKKIKQSIKAGHESLNVK